MMLNRGAIFVKKIVALEVVLLSILFTCPVCNATNPDLQGSFDYSVFEHLPGFSIVQESGTWTYNAAVRKELPDLTVDIGLSIGGNLDGSVLPAELHLSALNAQGSPAFSVNYFLVRLDGREFVFTPKPDGPSIKALLGTDGWQLIEAFPDARGMIVVFGNKSRSITVEFIQEELSDLETWTQNVKLWMNPELFKFGIIYRF